MLYFGGIMEEVKFTINLYDDNSIREYYDELVYIVNDAIIWGKDLSFISSDEEFDYLIMKLIDIIKEKLFESVRLSNYEAELFLHILYGETMEKLGLNNVAYMEFIEPDNKRLLFDGNGRCHYNGNKGTHIYYNKKMISEFCDSKIDVLERLVSLKAIPHELVHVKQCNDMSDGIINLENFVMTLEDILRIYGYYSDNYVFTRLEIDAETKGVSLLFDFLERHNIYDKIIIDEFRKFYGMMIDYEIKYSNNHNIIENGMELDISLEDYLLYKGTDYVKNNVDAIKRYPLLSLVYGDDGNLLTIKELFKKRLSLLEENNSLEKINEVYDFIIRGYRYMFSDELIIDEIELYLNNEGINDGFARSMLLKCLKPREKDEMTFEELDKKIKNHILTLKNNNFVG